MSAKMCEASEQVIRGLVKGVGVKAFFIGLHNAFVHGDALTDANYDFSDEQLNEMFKHFGGLNKIARKIEAAMIG